MATTDHPLALDLGKVTGLSVFEEWKLIEGNEDKTFDDFLDELADRGYAANVSNVVEQDNWNPVSSGGVWDKLAELGLVDERPPQAEGTPASEVLSYSLGDSPAPEEIDSAAGVGGTWTLTPREGQEWHVDNGGTAANALTVALPDGASIGSRVTVFFRPDNSLSECADVTVSAGGVLIGGDETPETVGGVVVEATMSKFGWIVLRHYVAGDPSIGTNSYRIVYSGANRASTESVSYTSVVSWSDGAATKSATLRTDVFRSLYGIAPFAGWATSPTGTTAAYADGATVSLGDGQTLTLYPLYSATDRAVNLGKTTDGQISTAAGASSKTESVGSYTFNPASYVSGFAGEAYSIKLYGTISSENNHTSRVEYKVDAGSWATLCERTAAGSSASDTKAVQLSGTGSHTIQFRVFQDSGTQACKSTYRCYVSAITVK